jgi:hypothetical protein
MLSLAILTIALIAVTRWLYHLPERRAPKSPWCATRKEPTP